MRYRMGGDEPAESQKSPPSTGDDSGKEAAQTIRVLVLMNDKRALMAGLVFLQRRGYQIKVISGLSEAIQQLTAVHPHVMLISWNLKRTDVRRIYTLLTTKFNMICIVFAEDNSTKSSAALMSSGIPHTLLPPVSGPGMHMRIQALLKAKAQATEKKKSWFDRNFEREEKPNERYGTVKIKSSELPEDATWEKVSGGGAKGIDKQVWKGTAKVKGKDMVYYFSGPAAPKYDSYKQRWVAPDGLEADFRVEGGDSTEFSETENGLKATELSALQEGLNGTEFSAVQEGLDPKDAKDLTAIADELADPEFDWDAATSEVEKDLKALETDLLSEFSAEEDHEREKARKEKEEIERKAQEAERKAKEKAEREAAEAKRQGLLKAQRDAELQKQKELDAKFAESLKKTEAEMEARKAAEAERAREMEVKREAAFRESNELAKARKEADQKKFDEWGDDPRGKNSKKEEDQRESAERPKHTKRKSSKGGRSSEQSTSDSPESQDRDPFSEFENKGASPSSDSSDPEEQSSAGSAPGNAEEPSLGPDFSPTSENNASSSDSSHGSVAQAGASGTRASLVLKSKDRRTILAQGVEAAVGQSAVPSTNKSQSLNTVSKVTVTVIQSRQFKGYLVGGNASDLPDRDLMDTVYKKLTSAMQNFGEPLKPVANVLEVGFDPLPFMLWAENQAEFTVTSQHGDDNVAFAYIPIEHVPEVVEGENPDVLGISIEKDLVPQAELLFDLYIHMPKNNKYLRYLKNGAILTAKTIAKLLKFGIKTVYIRAADREQFYAYCARNSINSTILSEAA